MIKKALFGLMWFVIIFIVSYVATGVIVLFPTISTGSNQAIYEATHAFRNSYLIFFAIGSLILTASGTATGILPGTKDRARAKKKPRAKRKAHKKNK